MKIIATIGHQSLSEDMVRKIILGGADILRYNLSYRVIRENVNYIEAAQSIITELNSQARILLDFPNNKIRLGDFEEKIFAVREGEIITFRSGTYSPDCHEFVPVDTSKLGTKVYHGQSITIGDGQISVQVIDIINDDVILAQVQNSGIINYMKSFNFKYRIEKSELIKMHKTCLNIAAKVKPDYIAIPYIDEGTNEELKQMIVRENLTCKVLVEIAHSLPDHVFESICQDNFYNSVIIDRGEIAVNMPYERLGLYQKELIAIAKKIKKPIIISAQIIESVIQNYIPAKSDILDLTNIVLDGAEGIILGRETASTSRPIYTLSVVKKIISEVEKRRPLFTNEEDGEQEHAISP